MTRSIQLKHKNKRTFIKHPGAGALAADNVSNLVNGKLVLNPKA
ncbi:MAG: hypothetical protein RIC19_20065 [Phaeodactylibacter sp.]